MLRRGSDPNAHFHGKRSLVAVAFCTGPIFHDSSDMYVEIGAASRFCELVVEHFKNRAPTATGRGGLLQKILLKKRKIGVFRGNC